MVYKIISTLSKAEISGRLDTEAKKYGFGVLGLYDFKKILKEKKFPIQKDITVFELCNPKAAQKALEYDAEISVYLPCRVSVYEENGKTVVATIHIEDIINSIEVDSAFKEFMLNVFNELKGLINSFKE